MKLHLRTLRLRGNRHATAFCKDSGQTDTTRSLGLWAPLTHAEIWHVGGDGYPRPKEESVGDADGVLRRLLPQYWLAAAWWSCNDHRSSLVNARESSLSGFEIARVVPSVRLASVKLRVAIDRIEEASRERTPTFQTAKLCAPTLQSRSFFLCLCFPETLLLTLGEPGLVLADVRIAISPGRSKVRL